MNAIIIPLNKFFFNFEKYDGTSAADRFWKRHSGIHKLINTKVGSKIAIGSLAIPLMLFYFLPIFIWNYFRHGLEKTKIKLDKVLDYRISRMDPWTRKSKNIPARLKEFQQKGFKVFVYYTYEMIPKDKTEKQLFFGKTDEMKAALNLRRVFFVRDKSDIEKLITEFGINVSKSFFMTDGKIDLSSYPQLRN